ncbi:GGDEF domain-containing protein [Actinoplanes sp. NPDC051851]|uniref:GGDEF domain-containing protein n=1 Tax=Actinoplanes sp. NPDC051851 TaxID=3154753 RepID=UPI003428421F
MSARRFRGRAAARAAVAALSLGVVALAGLSVFSMAANAATTAHIRVLGKQSDQWGRLTLNVNIEYEALTDYVRDSSVTGREPLLTAIGSADENLTWLAEQGDPTDVARAADVGNSYAAYTSTLWELIAADGRDDTEAADVLYGQATLAASTLRKSAMAQVARKRLETDRYLSAADDRNRNLMLAATGIFVVDLILLALCARVLLSYQRRVEGEAIEHQHRALHDGLTGLANRIMLTAQVEDALRQADLARTPVALLLLDLNKFKEVNDTLGHHTGDLLLQEVAARLSAAVRDGDTVARLGGDEFAVLVPQVASAGAALETAKRLLDAVQGPAELDGHPVMISGSIGAAVYPVHAASPGMLFQRADVAMYTAKRTGSGAALYQVGMEGDLASRPAAPDPVASDPVVGSRPVEPVGEAAG